MTRPVPMSGPAAWALILREHPNDPVQAMRLLRVAGCCANRRAILAVDTWCAMSTAQTVLALSTLRSVPALLVGLGRTGWDAATPDPDGSLARLRKRAGSGIEAPVEGAPSGRI